MQHTSLKSLANNVLERNRPRIRGATDAIELVALENAYATNSPRAPQASNDSDAPRWTVANQEAVLRWLCFIGETNAGIIREVLDRCRIDPVSRTYFVRRAENELPAEPVKHERSTP